MPARAKALARCETQASPRTQAELRLLAERRLRLRVVADPEGCQASSAAAREALRSIFSPQRAQNRHLRDICRPQCRQWIAGGRRLSSILLSVLTVNAAD
jgi:hypothetical protein